MVSMLQYPMVDVEEKQAVTSDMAEKGICFQTTEHYEQGSTLKLAINLYGWQNYLQSTASLLDAETMSKPLTAIGEVVWSRELDSKGGYEVGIEFKDIYEDDLKAFKKYLALVLSKTK